MGNFIDEELQALETRVRGETIQFLKGLRDRIRAAFGSDLCGLRCTIN